MLSFVLYGNNTEYRKEKTIERVTGSVNFYHAYEQHKNVYNNFPSKHISLESDDFSENYKRYGIEYIKKPV